MRAGRIQGIPVRIHPVTPVVIAAAVWLGEGGRLIAMGGSLLFHELMHVAAARILRVRVVEMELTPIGGAARMENLWRLRPGQMAAVALAGPAGNLFLMICAAALCWWELLPPCWAAALIEQNAIIFLFNIIPALPMDGGRVLCGMLERRWPVAAAARIGIWMGYGLAAMLTGLTMYGLAQGRVNITFPAAAVYLAMSARREKRQAERAWLESLTGRAGEMEAEGVLPVCWLAVRDGVTAREAAVRMKPRHIHMLAVYDRRMQLSKVIDERELMEALLVDSERKMGEMEGDIGRKLYG